MIGSSLVFASGKKLFRPKKSVRYEDALEEALCFSWIDSVVSRVDDERYMGWIESAKRPETRARRIAETIRRVDVKRFLGTSSGYRYLPRQSSKTRSDQSSWL